MPKVTLKLHGIAAMRQKLALIRRLGPRAAGVGLFVVASDLMDESAELVPVQTGALKNSRYVTPPTAGTKPTVEVGFGKPYAVQQHEDMGKRSPKFLERPFYAAGSGADRKIGDAVRDGLQSGSAPSQPARHPKRPR